MKRYFIRATRYLLYVIVIFVVIFFLMNITGYSKITPDMLGVFFSSAQAMIMGAVVLALVVVHPFIAYIKRAFGVDMVANRKNVVALFDSYGYALESESQSEMIFRTKSKLRRFISPYEDAIIIDLTAFPTTIEGNRKTVVKVMYRLKP
ncbi:MAG: hypothetical protein RR141_02490 [Rikenellaceae bacterium]